MAQTNRDRVHRSLDLLQEGLGPFVEREMQARYGDDWASEAQQVLREDQDWRGPGLQLDVQGLLLLMWFRWSEVFKCTLGHAERALVSELRGVRNRDAHQEVFSTDDAYRALDSVQRLLAAISAPQAVEVDGMKQELLRTRYAERARQVTRRQTSAPIEGQPAGGLRPWREIITPHEDVASGRYQQAEFAADLNQVYRGEGAPEYRDPREFFSRTFITEGLRHLLTGAVRRLQGTGGDPVVELQTNFGGGKTHSMLALYHLFSGTPVAELPGIEALLAEAGIPAPPAARRAVLVGQALSPAAPRRKPDGIEVRTLWGELAWQLGGAEGYSLVAEADRAGVNPGSDALGEVFRQAAPCLILIDEWVAYLRQLYHLPHLPGASFEANLTFAQALTEAARAVPRVLLVASLPSSDIEIGGEGGREALTRLEHTFARVQSPWRPASAEEGFEIVRRRLFQPIEPDGFPARDAVIRAFSDLYRTQGQEFPAACREGEYERRMRAAYPIHPELFDRLYQDWSSLDRFQRTRGVLRLMAATIHALWERQDSGLLILPAMVPVDQGAVQFELTQYLDDNWGPVIDRDVDGEHSLPLRLDRQIPNLGRYSAVRRVARTIYMGSAPTLHAAHKGIDARQITLGCVQPGESVPTFGDALRRLTDDATHLYVDGTRYWYSTQPSVTRLAEDRAAQLDNDTVSETIVKLLRPQSSTRGEFARVHVCPEGSADVPDDREARLVILSPTATHVGRSAESAARREAECILRQRGAAPRLYQNTLVFLAADHGRLSELETAVRQQLAWESICAEHETLNLDPFQLKQANTRREQSTLTVKKRIPETYAWLLVPYQEENSTTVEWADHRVQGDEALAVRATRKLVNEEQLVPNFAGVRLLRELNSIPLWRGESVSVKQLWEDFCRYLYLPRLTTQQVLLEAIQGGVAQLTWETDGFAYAEGQDNATGRYLALSNARAVQPIADGHSLVVRSDAARRQIDAETASTPPITVPGSGERLESTTSTNPDPDLEPISDPGRDPLPIPTRVEYHGTLDLDPLRLARDSAQIADSIVQHLLTLPGARVRVTLEIEAEADCISPDARRTIDENSRTLRVQTPGIEEV